MSGPQGPWICQSSRSCGVHLWIQQGRPDCTSKISRFPLTLKIFSAGAEGIELWWGWGCAFLDPLQTQGTQCGFVGGSEVPRCSRIAPAKVAVLGCPPGEGARIPLNPLQKLLLRSSVLEGIIGNHREP